ncbi:MAG: ABC transporter permease [Gemmatimonadetes bacterium]|nr:ABC transporter permease [Gemmatimonadota bacterium]
MSRRLELTFLAVHVLGVGIAFPLLSAYVLTLRPLGLASRWGFTTTPTPDLGFAWNAAASTAESRQTAGFSDLLGLALVLSIVVLLVTCATLVVLMVRHGWDRREELTVRTALGATRRDLRREVTRDWVHLSLLGSLSGLGLGLGLDAWLRAIAPDLIIPPTTPFAVLSIAALVAPALAVASAAGIEAAAALRRMKAPLAIDPIARLVQLGMGAVYVGALVAFLSVALHVVRDAPSSGVVNSGWDEARDTLVIDLARTGVPIGAPELASLSMEDPATAGRWHLASAGALEDHGVAETVLAECDCFVDGLGVPIIRLFAQHHSVSPGLFASVGVPLVAGREFTEADGPDAPPVAIIDERLIPGFRGVEPVGLRIRVGYEGGPGTWYEIIGVVSARTDRGIGGRPTPIGALYLSALQHPPAHPQLVVADGARDPDVALATLATALPATVVSGAVPLARRWTRWLEPFVWFATLATLFAIAVGGLSVIGLATSVMLEVRSRIPELGVRRAVGARRRHLRRLVLANVARILAWGCALGIMFGSGLVRGLADRYAALNSYDATTPALAALAVGVAALIGALGPLRRAGRITPIEAIGSVD